MATYDTTIRIQAIDNATQVFGGIAGAAQGLSRNLGRVGVETQLAGFRVAAAVGFPVQRFVRNLAEAGRDYSTAFNLLQSTTRASMEEMREMESMATNLADSTIFTATELLRSGSDLAQSGLTVQQILGTMRTTAELATAAQMDVAETARQLTNVMVSSDLPRETAEEAEMSARRVGDAVSFMASNANSTIEEAFRAMRQSSPIARQLGVDIEELSAMIGVLGNSGFNAGEAGTGLRTSMIRLVAPTSRALAVYERLNLELDDFVTRSGQLSGQGLADFLSGQGMIPSDMRANLGSSFDEIFASGDALGDQMSSVRQLLADTLSGSAIDQETLNDMVRQYFLSDVQSFDLFGMLGQLNNANLGVPDLQAIFGTHQYSRGSTLVEGIEQILNLTQRIRDEGFGSLTERAAMFLRGMSGALELLRSAFSNFMISITTGGTGEAMIDFIFGLRSAFQWLAEAPDGIKTTIIAIAALVAGLGPLLIYLGFLIQSLGAIAGVFGLAARGARLFGLALASSIGAIPFAIIGAGLYSIYRAAEQYLGDDNAIYTFFASIRGMARGAFEFLRAFSRGSAEDQELYLNVIRAQWSRFQGALSEILSSVGQGILDFVFGTERAGRAAEVLGGFWNALTGVVGNIIAAVARFAQILWGDASDSAGHFQQRLGEIRDGFLNATESVTAFLNSLGDQDDFLAAIERFAAGFRDTLYPAIELVLVALRGIRDIIVEIAGFIDGLFGGDLSGALAGMDPAYLAGVGVAVGLIAAAFRRVLAPVRLVVRAVRSIARAIAGALRTGGRLAGSFRGLAAPLRVAAGIAAGIAASMAAAVASMRAVTTGSGSRPNSNSPWARPGASAPTSGQPGLLSRMGGGVSGMMNASLAMAGRGVVTDVLDSILGSEATGNVVRASDAIATMGMSEGLRNLIDLMNGTTASGTTPVAGALGMDAWDTAALVRDPQFAMRRGGENFLPPAREVTPFSDAGVQSDGALAARVEDLGSKLAGIQASLTGGEVRAEIEGQAQVNVRVVAEGGSATGSASSSGDIEANLNVGSSDIAVTP